MVDVGSGAGFDSFVAADQVGPVGRVVGVDMTARCSTSRARPPRTLGFDHVEFREGLAEALPVEDGWADVVISNGVINLCADKRAVFDEIRRVLRPGGWLQFADIANGRPVPVGGDARRRPVDRLNCRWAAPCGLADDARAGRLHRRRIGEPVDTFAGADGEANARTFEVFGFAFLARATPRNNGPSSRLRARRRSRRPSGPATELEKTMTQRSGSSSTAPIPPASGTFWSEALGYTTSAGPATM